MKKIKLFEEFITEKSNSIYDKILADNNLTQFLNYLVHDKKHVMDNKGTTPELEKVFRLTKGQKYNQPLYRGLYTESIEDFVIGETYEFPRYQSFSENLEIAERFSKNGLIIQVTNSVGGFNYGGYLVYSFEKLKKDDPKMYDAEDGDFMIEGALEEAEWLFPKNTNFIVQDISKKGKYTIISGEINI
jgi:hypothetical protein